MTIFAQFGQTQHTPNNLQDLWNKVFIVCLCIPNQNKTLKVKDINF